MTNDLPGSSPMRAATKEYQTPDTPPILCHKTVQAEKIICAVGICLLGLAQISLKSAAAD